MSRTPGTIRPPIPRIPPVPSADSERRPQANAMQARAIDVAVPLRCLRYLLLNPPISKRRRRQAIPCRAPQVRYALRSLGFLLFHPPIRSVVRASQRDASPSNRCSCAPSLPSLPSVESSDQQASTPPSDSMSRPPGTTRPPIPRIPSVQFFLCGRTQRGKRQRSARVTNRIAPSLPSVPFVVFGRTYRGKRQPNAPSKSRDAPSRPAVPREASQQAQQKKEPRMTGALSVSFSSRFVPPLAPQGTRDALRTSI